MSPAPNLVNQRHGPPHCRTCGHNRRPRIAKRSDLEGSGRVGRKARVSCVGTYLLQSCSFIWVLFPVCTHGSDCLCATCGGPQSPAPPGLRPRCHKSDSLSDTTWLPPKGLEFSIRTHTHYPSALIPPQICPPSLHLPSP